MEKNEYRKYSLFIDNREYSYSKKELADPNANLR